MKEELNSITETIIGAAIQVHRELGPGLLESAYEACLEYEITNRGRRVEKQVPVPVVYRGVNLECGYRLDLLVDGKVIVELKTLDKIIPIHEAQLLSYLKLMNLHVGLLLNFRAITMKEGVKRIVRDFPV